jgi:hypothetical protein
MQLGVRSLRSSADRSRYFATVLRSRPVCRAIAAFDQPRAANACISTSSSWVNIPHGPPHLSLALRTADGEGDHRQNDAHAPGHDSRLRPYGPSPTAAPRRVSSHPAGGGEFR